MSKIIQKQIRRSVPVVLIFVLVSSLVSSVVFNFNIITELPKELGSKLSLGFDLSTASAAGPNDLATTTVTVRNAPPTFTVNAAEVSASASTSPVNDGSGINFTATANDPESANYYLIVCGTNAVTPRNGQSPTCAVTTLCTSGATADDAEASCTYSSVTSATETRDWYAFVCDAHATEADCSTANQGSGDSGSPIYVNHRPVLNSVGTSVNNRDPGQAVTITATTTDTDAQGTWDTIVLNICSTNSWATSTGCAASTLCMATTTLTGGSATPLSCNYTIPVPSLDDAPYAYYAYIYDTHGLPANPNGSSSTYTVNNVRPVMGEVTINGGADITPNLKGVAQVSATTSVSVTDNNGCTDIDGATSTIYMATVSGGEFCTPDNNYCYRMTAGNCTKTSCVAAAATYVCSTTIAYLAHPTDDTDYNSASTTVWYGSIMVYDEALSTSSISVTGVELTSVTALEVTETAIPYGTIRSSFNSDTTNATTTIVNFGNTPLDTNVKGSDMTGPDTITVDNQKFSLVNFDYDLAGTALALGDQLAPINILKPTAGDLSSPIYWGINIPAGKPSGSYSGLNTFTALLYSGYAW